jgi:Tol biopolymer transport system component
VAAVLVVTGALVLRGDGERRQPQVPATGPAVPLPPEGQRILYAADGVVFALDARTGTTSELFPGSNPRWSPDGRAIASITQTGEIAVTDIMTGRSRTVATAGEELAWSPRGDRLGFVRDNAVFTVDVATGVEKKVATIDAPFVGLADWVPDGDALIIKLDRSAGGGITLHRLATAGGDPVPFLGEARGDTTGLRFAPDGSRVAFFAEDRRCICTAAADGSDVRIVHAFEAAPDTAQVSWSPDGTHLLWTEKSSGDLKIISVDRRVVRTVAVADTGRLTHDWR